MPRSRIEGLDSTRTSATRASYCSEALRTKRGQCALPGMMSRRPDIIWQPLQTPSVKVSPRAKKPWNCVRARSLNSTVFAQPPPAPSTSP